MNREEGLMNRFVLRGVFLALPLGVAACGAGERAPVTMVRTDTIAGVERLLYPGTGGARLGWRRDTLAVIGGAAAEEDVYQFGRVTPARLAGDGAGRLYLLDAASDRVLVYDSLGGHVATYGRKGEGPGELSGPSALAVSADDSIWVADWSNRRYTVYPIGGGEARSVALPEDLGFPDGPLAVRGGALIQGYRPLLQFLMRRATEGERGVPPRPIYRLNRTGEVQDTLWVSTPPKPTEAHAGSDAGGISIRRAPEYTPDRYWAAFSDGSIVVSDTAEYVLRVVAQDGTVVRRIERDMPARATTDADRERARERLDTSGAVREMIVVRSAGGGGPAISEDAVRKAQLEAMTFAPVIPRITGLRIDPLDRIWVGVSLDEPETTERIDVFDREGRLIGELTGWELPDVFLGRSLAARAVEDALDVPRIVIYRIAEPVGE
ncbi:MAG TPA: hypothetical protein VF188_06795 [Longimicrobiales bacterium]